MTLKSVTTSIGALAVIIAATSPTYAQVSNEVRRACEAKADQVRPYLRTPERAFGLLPTPPIDGGNHVRR